jgi:hypothetical protein
MPMMRTILYTGSVVALSLSCMANLAIAQEPAKSAPAKAAPPSPVVTRSSVPVPDITKLTLMIQLHVAALGLANLTGNYTVLHALGSPTFQAKNPPATLANNFAPFRSKGIDISPAMLFPPILLGPPNPEPNDIIRLAGFYNTNPQRIVFEIAFQAVDNAWRLADIKVQTVIPDSVALAAPTPSAAPGVAAAVALAPKAGKAPAAKK